MGSKASGDFSRGESVGCLTRPKDPRELLVSSNASTTTSLAKSKTLFIYNTWWWYRLYGGSFSCLELNTRDFSVTFFVPTFFGHTKMCFSFLLRHQDVTAVYFSCGFWKGRTELKGTHDIYNKWMLLWCQGHPRSIFWLGFGPNLFFTLKDYMFFVVDSWTIHPLQLPMKQISMCVVAVIEASLS